MTLQICEDLRAETDELYAFLKTLDEKDWETPTLFMDWTPWDIVAHLHYFDEVSLASLAGKDEFAASQKALMEGMKAGLSGQQQAKRALGEYDAPALLERWKSFDDDMAPGWPSGDVPVTAFSPAGMIYGTTAAADEVLSVILAPMPLPPFIWIAASRAK